MIAIVEFIVWLLNGIIEIYMLAIIAFALMSWFPGAYNTRIGRFIAKIVVPFENMFSFASIGMVSFAPVVAILVLTLMQNGIKYLGQLIIGF